MIDRDCVMKNFHRFDFCMTRSLVPGTHPDVSSVGIAGKLTIIVFALHSKEIRSENDGLRLLSCFGPYLIENRTPPIIRITIWSMPRNRRPARTARERHGGLITATSEDAGQVSSFRIMQPIASAE